MTADSMSRPHGPTKQLISYIALGAPATRRPATGNEAFLRPEIGFTPKWYHDALGLEFGERWHTDPAYRRDSLVAMARETQRRYGRRTALGVLQQPDQPLDLLTGTYGAVLVPALFGVPITYQAADWPWSAHGQFLNDAAADQLSPPDLDRSPLWEQFLGQFDWIARQNGQLVGYINWQGVLNTAYRLRGEELFSDLLTEPNRARHLFECVTQTMLEGMRRLYARQQATGVEVTHVTVSNCLVNMLSPRQYAEFVLPLDRRLAQAFSIIGVHNCAWKADPYVPHYATLDNLAYVDMGLESNLLNAKAAFPRARRALMYTPMALKEKTSAELAADLERIAREYGPCDLVCADIESGTPDARVHELLDRCEELSARFSA